MNFGTARKKPVEIKYFQWENNVENLKAWLTNVVESSFENNFEFTDTLRVKTLEGTSYNVKDGDVIVRGIKGEFYPCDLNIFKQTYTIE